MKSWAVETAVKLCWKKSKTKSKKYRFIKEYKIKKFNRFETEKIESKNRKNLIWRSNWPFGSSVLDVKKIATEDKLNEAANLKKKEF